MKLVPSNLSIAKHDRVSISLCPMEYPSMLLQLMLSDQKVNLFHTKPGHFSKGISEVVCPWREGPCKLFNSYFCLGFVDTSHIGFQSQTFQGLTISLVGLKSWDARQGMYPVLLRNSRFVNSLPIVGNIAGAEVSGEIRSQLPTCFNVVFFSFARYKGAAQFSGLCKDKSFRTQLQVQCVWKEVSAGSSYIAALNFLSQPLEYSITQVNSPKYVFKVVQSFWRTIWQLNFKCVYPLTLKSHLLIIEIVKQIFKQDTGTSYGRTFHSE